MDSVTWVTPDLRSGQPCLRLAYCQLAIGDTPRASSIRTSYRSRPMQRGNTLNRETPADLVSLTHRLFQMQADPTGKARCRAAATFSLPLPRVSTRRLSASLTA